MTLHLLAGPLGFALVLGLIALGFPIGISMALVGTVGAIWLGGWDQAAYILSNLPFESISGESMIVLPLFILMGVFAAHSGLSANLYTGVHALMGHHRGGIAMATVGASAVFGAITGSSLATAATIGRVAMPEMRARGYADSLASASVAAGGTLGVLIPPSIILILYAIMTMNSIGALFAAAFVPGLLATLLYMAAIFVLVRRKPELAPAGQRMPRPARIRALMGTWDAMLLIVVVIGGIYGKVFSPTEAAAVGAAGALLITIARGKLTRATVKAGVAETAGMVGMIFLILMGASIFNYFIELSGLTDFLLGGIQNAGMSPLGVLVLVIVFYIVLGCFMDSLSMVLLTVVPMYTLVTGIGYDPIWFGILLVCVTEIGLITPPIGMNLFVVQGTVPNLALTTIIRGILPFILADVVRIGVIVAIPSLVLFVPNWLGLG